MNTKSIFFFILLTAAIVVAIAPRHSIIRPIVQRVDEGGRYKIGMMGSTFSGWTDFDSRHSLDSPKGRFHIHLYTNDLPNEMIACLDLECGELARPIINRGGHLHATIDLKIGTNYGIRVPYSRAYKDYAYEHSLAVVTNETGIILGFFKNAELMDMESIVDQMKL